MIHKYELRARIFALSFLVFIEISSDYILEYVPPNDWYFAVCGIFNIATLLVFTALSSRPLMVALVKLTFLQLLIQFLGWCIYAISVTPLFYNCSIKVLVFVTFFRILWVGKDDRNYEDNLGGTVVHSHAYVRPRQTIGILK